MHQSYLHSSPIARSLISISSCYCIHNKLTQAKYEPGRQLASGSFNTKIAEWAHGLYLSVCVYKTCFCTFLLPNIRNTVVYFNTQCEEMFLRTKKPIPTSGLYFVSTCFSVSRPRPLPSLNRFWYSWWCTNCTYNNGWRQIASATFSNVCIYKRVIATTDDGRMACSWNALRFYWFYAILKYLPVFRVWIWMLSLQCKMIVVSYQNGFDQLILTALDALCTNTSEQEACIGFIA